MPPTTKQRQVSEILKCGKDPQYFINRYVKIQHPTRGTIKFDTYTFQDECLIAFNDHRFNIVVKSRQLGLSTLTAAYAAWLALFRKDKNILVIATKLAVAQNFIRKVKTAIRSLPKWMWLTEITGNNKQSLEFSNGSTIKAIPTSEDAGRSEALSLLIVDEAAFVRNFDILWTGLYPTLSTGGRAIIVSTPNGVGGQYYDLYQKAQSKQNEFNAIHLPWDVHPERDDVWFENECKNLTRKQVAQELLCSFQASGDTFLAIDEIEKLERLCTPPIERWGPNQAVWVWKYALPAKEYVISADVARGDGGDYSAFHVINTTDSEVVAEYKGKIPPDQFAFLLAEAGKRYDNALVCPESNTYGYAVLMKLKEIDYRNIYFNKQKDKFEALYGNGTIGKAGFSTQGISRAKILTKLEESLRNNKVKINSSRFVDEIKTFIWKGNRAQAMSGKNDDLVMSLAIGLWLYDTKAQHSSSGVDLNAAMLAGFALNKDARNESSKNRSMWDAMGQYGGRFSTYKRPVILNPEEPYLSGSSAAGNFNWLIK